MLDAMVNDPVVFSRAVLGSDLLDYQAEIATALETHSVAVRSCNSIGKSETLATIIAWWITRRPQSSVMLTAPTWKQVSQVVWSKVRKLHAQASARQVRLPSGRIMSGGLGGEITETRWVVSSKNPDIGAFPRASTSKENLMGIHADHMLFAVDEASGVKPFVWEAGNSMATGKHDRIIMIGNPTIAHGRFYDVFHRPDAYADFKRFHINAEQLPWVRDRTDPPFAGMASWQWIDRMRNSLPGGRNNPWYQVHILGDFCKSDGTLLIPLSDLEACAYEPGVEEPSCETGGPAVLGVDIGETNDRTVLVRIHGDVMTHIEKYNNKDIATITGLIQEWVRREGCAVDMVAVDAVGVGSGVFANLSVLGVPTVAFKGSFQAVETERFVNTRAEAYQGIADDLCAGTISIIRDDDLIGQLAYQPKTVDHNGKLLLWNKKDWAKASEKKLVNYRSPDCADALTIARWGQRLLVSGLAMDHFMIRQPTIGDGFYQ